ncbi:MAG: chorismate mutase [Alphaproteobacteria bacterium]|nr:chorismate mutase [Alphaproteobacteria bacterium]
MDILTPYRTRIDALDDQIVDLIAARFDIIHEVAAVKIQHRIPAVLPDRVNEVINRAVSRAENHGIDPHLMRDLYTKIVSHSCDLETQHISRTDPDIHRAG